jgi:zinc D-Ala-D-Ala carboxypeptidase
MDTSLLKALTRVKLRIGDRIRINSGYRTRNHNARVGGSEHSLHMEGKACDIAAISKERKYQIIKAAMEEGIPRIGIAERFIHLDVGTGKRHQKPRIWLY